MHRHLLDGQAVACYDPDLNKPTHVSGPKPPRLRPEERARLESERACLIRERHNTQCAIDHITAKLAA